MLSTKTTVACALVASTCLVGQADAFWLIPGSTSVKTANNIIRSTTDEHSSYNKLQAVLKEKYAQILGASSGADANDYSVYDEILRALDEVSTDIGSTATMAKTTLKSGMYFRQNGEEYLLAMDVPGLHTREVEVIADKGTLRIKGEHTCPKLAVTEKPDPLCVERYFDASFTFPSDADEDASDAKLDAGVVYVKVPKIKGERRGVGRLLKITGDTAEWVYEETGAKTVVDSTTAKAQEVYDSAANVAQNIKDQVVGAAGSATAAAIDASASAKAAAVDASASAKSAAVAASASAKSAALEASASAASAAAKATNNAKQSADDAKHYVKDSANGAQKAAYDSANHAQNIVKDATASLKAGETPVVVADKAGFMDRLKKKIVGDGSAEGQVPVVNKNEL